MRNVYLQSSRIERLESRRMFSVVVTSSPITIITSPLSTATVYVFNDLNGDGIKEHSEPLLSNWPVTTTGLPQIVTRTDQTGVASLPFQLSASVEVSDVAGWRATNSPVAVDTTHLVVQLGVTQPPS